MPIAASTAAALIAAGSSAAGQGAAAVRGRKNRKYARAGNKAARAQARQQQIKMLQYQNAYNSPQQQMERYRAAGLNPNLIYGQGATGAGAMTGSPPEQANYQESPYNVPAIDYGVPTTSYLNAAQTVANTAYRKSQTAEKDVITKWLPTLNERKTALLYQQWEENLPADHESYSLTGRRAAMNAETRLKEKNTVLAGLSVVAKNITNFNLKHGITPQDSPDLRLTISMLQQMEGVTSQQIRAVLAAQNLSKGVIDSIFKAYGIKTVGSGLNPQRGRTKNQRSFRSNASQSLNRSKNRRAFQNR